MTFDEATFTSARMSWSEFTQFQVPTRIVMRPGLVQDCGAEWGALSVRRPLLLADAGVERAGLLATVQRGLAAAGAEIAASYTAIPPNSEVRVVQACVESARRHRADSVVAVGGGSVIDTAKLTALLLTHGGTLDDYAGAQTIPGPLWPVLAIPTTAGTGSEVTQAALVYDAQTQRKLSFVDEHLRPRLALLDPELTRSLPPLLTAATGMDAIVHAIEAYVDIQHGVFSDACAAQALQLARRWLLPAVQRGDDLEARSAMLAAATLAGIAFDHSMVGVVHAMAHALGALAPIHHGTANAILLPLGMEYNREACSDRYAALARALQLTDAGHDGDDVRAAAVLRTWIETLRQELHTACGLPRTLAEAQLDRVLIPQIAAIAEEDGASFYNPRPVEAAAIEQLVSTFWDTQTNTGV